MRAMSATGYRHALRAAQTGTVDYATLPPAVKIRFLMTGAKLYSYRWQ